MSIVLEDEPCNFHLGGAQDFQMSVGSSVLMQPVNWALYVVAAVYYPLLVRFQTKLSLLLVWLGCWNDVPECDKLYQVWNCEARPIVDIESTCGSRVALPQQWSALVSGLGKKEWGYALGSHETSHFRYCHLSSIDKGKRFLLLHKRTSAYLT
jgi:hypothetical protein